MLAFFLKLSISKQIQIGVTIVVLVSIVLFQLLILIAIFVQMNYIFIFFYSLIENEENALMRNFNLMLEKYESLVIEKTKTEAQLLRLYLNNLLDNDEVMAHFNQSLTEKLITTVLTLGDSSNNDNNYYYVKNFDSKADTQIIDVSPLLKPLLDNMINNSHSVYEGYKLYTKNIILCYNKGNSNTNINNCITDLREITDSSSLNSIVNQTVNASYTYVTQLITGLNTPDDAKSEFKKIINLNPIIYHNTNPSLVQSINYSETKKSNSITDGDSLMNDFNFLMELQLSNNQLDLLTNIISSLPNALFILTNPSTTDNKLLTTDTCQILINYYDLSLTYSSTSPLTISDCFNHSSLSPTNHQTLFSNDAQAEDYSFHIKVLSEDDPITDSNLKYHFLLSKSSYPTTSYNNLNPSSFIQTEKLINYIVYNNNKKYYHKTIVYNICLSYFIIIALFNYSIWALLLIYIFIRVLFISWKISKPIDDLIQSISQNNLIDNQAQNDLKKKLEKISYKDDYIINELFMLCKKLIIGGFKQFAEQQKKRMKMIQANDSNSKMLFNIAMTSQCKVNSQNKKDYFAPLEDEDSIWDSYQSNNNSITIGSKDDANEEDEDISLMKHTTNKMDIKEINPIKQKITFKPQQDKGIWNFHQHGHMNIFQESNHFLTGYSFKKIFLNHEEQIGQENEYYSLLKSFGEGVTLPKFNDNDKGSPRKTLFKIGQP